MYWNFGQFLWAKRYLLSVFQIHWHKCIFSLEAEAELISADERRDYSALNAVRLLCSDDSEGTIHILRNHIFRGFFVPSPLPKHISCTENKQKLPFSNPIPPQTSAYGIYEWSPEAISAEGLRGKWTEYMKCQGKTDFITGVRLKSEPWKGWGKPSSQSTYYTPGKKRNFWRSILPLAIQKL